MEIFFLANPADPCVSTSACTDRYHRDINMALTGITVFRILFNSLYFFYFFYFFVLGSRWINSSLTPDHERRRVLRVRVIGRAKKLGRRLSLSRLHK